MVEARPYEESKHWAMLRSWLAARRSEAAAASPEFFRTLGVVVYVDNIPRAAMWGYKGENVPAGRIGWAVTKPGNSAKMSFEALGVALEAVLYQLDRCGCRMVFGGFAPRGLNNLLERHGFIRTGGGEMVFKMEDRGWV